VIKLKARDDVDAYHHGLLKGGGLKCKTRIFTDSLPIRYPERTGFPPARERQASNEL
jgi:hypothetical protein